MTRIALSGLLLATNVTLLCGLLALASRVWRRDDARLWHGVWTMVVAGTMAGALLLLAAPSALARFPLVPPVSPVTSLLGAPGSATGGIGTFAAWLANALGTAAPALVAIYVVGVVALGWRLAAGWWRVRRLATLAYPPAPVHFDRLEVMRAATGVRKRVEFLVYPRLQTAVTIGWRRPVILLPDRWMRWPLDRLEAVVRHEIAHVARGDFALNLLAAIAETLLWFVPGVWIATGRMRLLAEMAADDEAAGPVGHIEYARQLLEAAASLPSGGRSRLSPAPGIAADLRRRFDALLRPAGHRRAPLGPFGRVAMLLAALWLVLAVVSVGASSGSGSQAGSAESLHRAVINHVHSLFSHLNHPGH